MRMMMISSFIRVDYVLKKSQTPLNTAAITLRKNPQLLSLIYSIITKANRKGGAR